MSDLIKYHGGTILETNYKSKCCSVEVIKFKAGKEWTGYACFKCNNKNPLSTEDLLKETKK